MNTTLTSYHAQYYAYELTRSRTADDQDKFTASLQDATVDLNPHQVEAALFAFKSPLSKGALLADEVGLGKTIEAGIILSQKWAERKRKLLIIAPANLRKQWNQELADKFFLPSTIIEAKSFNQIIRSGNLNPFEQNEILICSYQFARAKETWLRHIQWDLVIIDEAHRLRNVYRPDNKIGKSIKSALAHTQKVLLTATPLQNSLLELYGLVSIIDDYTFGDLKSFKTNYARIGGNEQYNDLKERLKPVCKRTLRRQVLEYISFTNRLAIVEEFYPYQEEQQLYDDVSDYLRSDKLYALPASQRHLMTMILRKLLSSSTFAIQGTLQKLATKLDAHLQGQTAIQLDDIAQDYEGFEELADEWAENDETKRNKPEPIPEEERPQALEEKQKLQQFAALASTIQKNSKGVKLLTALTKGFEKLQELGAAKKAIIFTESTRTQQYLKEILETQGYAGQIVLFNGTNNDTHSRAIYTDWMQHHAGTDRISGSHSADKRQAIVDWFRNEATIMIATEAAAEGINLQFCSLVVNYDLPWNPQRIEQRIGRCHRYGQKFDVVVINFLNKANAADQRVYQLLDQKFKLFSGVFGASDEVLGAIESGVDFEKRIARIYKECRTAQEIQEAFDALEATFEEEKQQKLDNTKLQLLENFDDEVHRKLRVNLQQGKEYLNLFEQRLWGITEWALNSSADFHPETYSFTLKANPFQNPAIHLGNYQLLKSATDRKKSEIDLAATANIYRIGHPLAQSVIESCKTRNPGSTHLLFDYANTLLKITVLEPLLGHSGWLTLSLLSISSFEKEEHLIFSGTTDDGTPLDGELCQKLFNLSAKEMETVTIPKETTATLNAIRTQQIQAILDNSMQRNARFFDDEYEKLDKWADDMKLSLEREIKDLDAGIRLRKAEARKLSDLESKVKERRHVKELEKLRDDKRRHLFEAQDQIESKKDGLLEDVEARMASRTEKETLFTIRWSLK
ncbi:SNF2-related protein [Chlorobium phaeobacteroides]|uniref:Helicase domain protein n=1 Tax=Chlorobium phaeobacteroides (strain DSM 266 / SMG 266 / 2430) TaxID=290317 RepID=A1BHU0_CHLPD|nr:SNF2-related protein [Chlorobium phaeobacteroides]ABL65967.1 helicase domain protein [Chlorobium phaeobacteroides DSM 266]